MAISEFEKTLLTTQPFKYLNRQELDVIKSYCKNVTFKKNELLLEQGKKGNGMYIILEGSALVVAKSLGKSPITLRTLEQGNFVGEISLMQDVASQSTVIANSDVECLLISTNYFEMLYLFFPEIRYKITRAIAEEIVGRIQEAHKKIIDIMTQTDMTKMTFATKFIKSFGSQDSTTFAESKINIDDLMKYQLLRMLSKNELDDLLNQSDLIKTSIKCSLIKEGEENTPYYIIIRGAVQLSILANDKLAKVAVLSPVSLFGNISFIVNTPSIINYTTCERTILLRIPQRNLKSLEENNKQLWYKLFNGICGSFVSLESATNKLIIRLNSEIYNR